MSVRSACSGEGKRGLCRPAGAEETPIRQGGKILCTTTKSTWRTAAVGLLPGIAWGLLVLVLTLALLVLGAIVLPARAYKTPAQGTLIACATGIAPKNWQLLHRE